jgi:hypothetical protein
MTTTPIQTRRGFLLNALALVASGSGAGAISWPQQPPALRNRRVWLRLLLNQIAEQLKTGKPLTDEERYLAGLTRVRYLYVDLDHHDLILEGPAEDRWEAQPDGSVLGAATGQPLLQLDDLAVAWRNAVEGSPPPSVSLEPRRESIQRIGHVVRGAGQLRSAAARDDFAKRLADSWGEQDAVTGGVPQHTRFNKVMVDADWEMKRISLGQLQSGVEDFPNYVDLEFADLKRRVAAEGAGARKPPGGSRFWFFPAYAEFARSENSDAVAIPDDPVQLLTESHFRNLAQGKQVVAEPSPAAKEFVEAFTTHYAAIAAANPLYAELSNLFDWVAVVRLIRMLDVPKRIGWDFAALRQLPPARPIQVAGTMPGLVAVRHDELRTAQGVANLVFPAWGGVSIDLDRCAVGERWVIDRTLDRRVGAALVTRPTTPSRWWRSG